MSSRLQRNAKSLYQPLKSPLPDFRRRLPFWVREVDEPTVEIDWDRLAPFPGVNQTLFNPEVYGPEEYFRLCDAQKQYDVDFMKRKVAGHSIQDNAIANASNWLWKGLDLPWADGPTWETDPLHPVFYTPEEFGVPRYEGTPAQNSRMIEVAARVFGAAEVGFVRLDERAKKLVYGEVRYEDVEVGYDPGDGTKVLPKKDLWVICALIPQSLLFGKATSDSNWAATNGLAYSMSHIYSGRMMSFLRSLGYHSYGGDFNALGVAVGFGVLAGLGEYSRMGQLVSPRYGAMVRTCYVIATDLPLEETKPIDAGIMRFCKTCMKCARTCPSGAISMKRDPYWGGSDPWQNEGIRGYHIRGKACFSQMFKYPTNCGVCQTVCPYDKLDKAVLHDGIKIAIKYAPIFNGIIAHMDNLFGYGLEETDRDLIWRREPSSIPLFGLDESRS